MRPLERSRRRWDDHIKLTLKKMHRGLDCADLAQDRGKGQGCLWTLGAGLSVHLRGRVVCSP
jgi:hypothetical protein